LLDVVLGNPVTLANEWKAVPITKDELAKFVGVFDLTPTFSVTFELSGDSLTEQGTGRPALPMMYVGVKDGHPRFFFRADICRVRVCAGCGRHVYVNGAAPARA